MSVVLYYHGQTRGSVTFVLPLADTCLWCWITMGRHTPVAHTALGLPLQHNGWICVIVS